MHVKNRPVERYSAFLTDKYRPPSRGGNTRAWHRHCLVVDGETYAFLAAWAGKFVYKGETVSFDWDWDKTKTYRNIDVSSVEAHKPNGQTILRGDRGAKVWRTAETPLPAGRRERKD